MDSRTSTMDSTSSTASGQIYGGQDQYAQDMNSSMSSLSSAESDLDARDKGWEQGKKSKREAALEAVEDPSKLKDVFGQVSHHKHGESSKA